MTPRQSLRREIEALPEANDGTAGEWSLVERRAVLAAVTADSLDEAWAAAEAAVPAEMGWFGPCVEPRWPNRWRAFLFRADGLVPVIDSFAESEAAALLALARHLRENPL